MKAWLLAVALVAGCATTQSSTRLARCERLCAQVLHPMSLAETGEDERSCTCWAPASAFEPSRPVTATIRITETEVAAR